jgi:hypothetical protein
MGFARRDLNEAARGLPAAKKEEDAMARTIVLRTKDDAKVWLVDLDGRTVSEIEGDAIGDQSSFVQEADVLIAATVRTAAASHALFDA